MGSNLKNENGIKNLSEWRQNYQRGKLDEQEVLKDPYDMFEKWMKEAGDAGILEPNAMALATVGAGGFPSVRMVLLKHFDRNGFVFFTNYGSRKGMQIEQNPMGAILFFWDKPERQIRIEGVIKKVAETVSDQYFHSRPLESRIAAAISPQSKIIDKKTLEKAFNKMKDDYPDGDIIRPSNWGGYQLAPHLFEFWQGRPGRLHDRLQYRIDSAGINQKGDFASAAVQKEEKWIIERLAP